MREKIVYELECDSCGNDFELSYIEENNSDEPIYCPFCGSDIDLEDIEEVNDESFLDDGIEMEELNFDDERD
jgi:DNA-directed RNA polymerase subunit RPC12/RpoP